MTVIRRKQQTYNYQNSNNASDTESLNLVSATTSDVESLNNEPTATRTYGNIRKAFLHNDDLTLKKNCGRRKFRRYSNGCLLESLSEEDENDNSFVTLMSPYKGPLTRLLEDNDALEYWNDFISKSEEEQENIIRTSSIQSTYSIKIKKEIHPFSKISSKIRRTIKIRKNLSTEFVQTCEEELIDFFKITPKDVFKRVPPNSFERLLFHAIAQYHDLNSVSILENGSRRIEVYNSKENWIPADCYLYNFIAEQKS